MIWKTRAWLFILWLEIHITEKITKQIIIVYKLLIKD